MDFFTGSDKNSPEVGLFPFPVFKFKFSRLHLSILAKSWWKWGPKMAKMLKTGNGSWIFHRKCQKKPISVSGFQKMTNFLGISTGSSSISAGSQLFFQNFQGFTRLVAKSWWKWGLKMAKLLKKRKRKLIFLRKSNFSRLHLSILAKSCEIWQQETEMGSKYA